MGSRHLLNLYYNNIFPFGKFVEWLQYDHELEKGDNPYRTREFGFTLENDVFYKEHLTVSNNKDFKESLFKKVPIKIDIGAEYDIVSTDIMNGASMPPFRKELIIDIDISDYDEVRTCCQGEKICTKCWKYLSLACKILESIFQVEYGIKNTLWVFSGRRGIHCWVCDAQVREFNTQDRRDFVTFFLDIPQNILNRVFIRHPIDIRVMEMINNTFIEICLTDQDLLKTREDVKNFITKLPDANVRGIFLTEMLKHETSVDRWNAFESLYNQLKKTNSLKGDMILNFVDYVKTQYTFPRLDINVTKSDSHFLKAPFCVHPRTQNICVPFNAVDIDKFDINNVPAIDTLFDDGKKHLFGHYLSIFEQFLTKLKDN